MLRNSEVQNSSAIMSDDKEPIQHTEGQCRYSEKVHRRYGFPVVTQECCPSLRWLRVSRSSTHPAQHSSFRDVKTEHLELAMNPRRTPGLVFCNHAEDQFAKFFTDTSPTARGAMTG